MRANITFLIGSHRDRRGQSLKKILEKDLNHFKGHTLLTNGPTSMPPPLRGSHTVPKLHLNDNTTHSDSPNKTACSKHPNTSPNSTTTGDQVLNTCAYRGQFSITILH